MAVNIAQATTSSPVAAQNQQALRQVFSTIGPDSCPHFYNFHMHTNCSDGQLKPEVLIEQAVTIGLKGFAITDHHTVNGYKIAQDWLNNLQQQTLNQIPHLWTGVEITSELLATEVHILGYAFDPEYPAIKPYLQGKAPRHNAAQAEAVIEVLHQAGGIAVLAHPVRYRRSAEDLIAGAADLGIDGVEAYYAYNNPESWKASPLQTERVKLLSSAYNLLNTCGTDTHGLNLLRRM